MFNADELWPIFLENAERYKQRRTRYLSLPRGKPYRIILIRREVVHIERDGDAREETISKEKFTTCIRQLNENNENSFIRNAGIYKNVATETTIVELLPMLDWYKEGGDMMILSAPDSRPSITSREGDPNQAGWYWAERRIRARRGQTKLRLKLFDVFGGSCGITNCSVKEVLDACHIHPFSESENCFIENALLLRADLHDLFDAHLLGINPVTREVNIDGSVLYGEYRGIHGSILRNPVGIELDEALLGLRWQRFHEMAKGSNATGRAG